MPEEKILKEASGPIGGEKSGKEQSLNSEMKRKMMEGKEQMMERAHSTGRHLRSESGKMSKAEAGRLGGEASAGSIKHYTEESKRRQLEGARKGGEHFHRGRSAGTSTTAGISSKESGSMAAESRWESE